MDDKIRAVSERDRNLLLGESAESATERNAGVEWGAASLALGGVFALLAPIGLFLAAFLQSTNFQGFSHTDKRIAALGGYGSVFFILMLVIVGIVFGVVSMNASRRQRRPIALGLAGVLLNALDLFMWIGAALAWFATTWNLL